MKKTYSRKITSKTKKDLLQNKYLVADRNIIWTIDATFIYSGVLILVIDLATRLIIGHLYLHKYKANAFSSNQVILLLSKCLKARSITEPKQLTIHSDRGFQFTSNEFINFCQEQGFNQSLNEKPLNNQVSESINGKIKNLLRLKIKPLITNKKFILDKSQDSLQYLIKLKKETILQTIQFAIDEHNNQASTYNQEVSPFNYDNALFDSTREKPKVLAANAKDSTNALVVQNYRNDVTFDYAQAWAHFFDKYPNKQDIQFEIARRERAILYEQNRTLQATIKQQSNQLNEQSSLIKKQSAQIQELIDYQKENIREKALKQQRKAKNAAAKRQIPRDIITPTEFTQILTSIKVNSLKYARIKVALVLLYITGLRVANLLVFQVRHIKELLNKQNTTILINKNGGIKKIVIGKECKKWFKLIQSNTDLLLEGKKEDQFLFTNKHEHIISREQFTRDINKVLKTFAKSSGKQLKSHSFRISLITELLRDNTLQDVKNIIGHQDIRTTDLYNRRFMTERECYNALQHLAKKRAYQSKIK